VNDGIAIVGLACEYPDASSPERLWENVLARRQAFRRMPPVRLSLDDYYDPDPATPDTTTCTEAALIEGFAFDRARFKVPARTFEACDPAHWLALDVAARALEDAGFPGGEGLDHATTGVIVGNTLTGEVSRAATLRLRWPYVRRTLGAALADDGWTPDLRASFLDRFEARFKAPFPAMDEESLAGGLSNTIAGRIANHFDLGGGDYVVDGACASSLLAVLQAAGHLVAGDMDAVLAGGVDLSLDPFELVGFAKTGALATGQMRVYDRRADGFWPGEGCGFALLMRLADALARNLPIHAVIRGWGLSSDGAGGITRPEIDGQRRALDRAYRRAGCGIETVSYFEGHGTGTARGDATELEALSQELRAHQPVGRGAIIGSVKANIGHTKAAAGMAALTKTVMAIRADVVPPNTACEAPHPALAATPAVLRVTTEAEPWPRDRPRRAGVSAFGFGGINTHVVIEGLERARRPASSFAADRLARSPQDAELFAFAAATAEELDRMVRRVAGLAAGLARSELTDLAARLSNEAGPRGCRACIVASTPRELATRAARLCDAIAAGATIAGDGVCFSAGGARPWVVFMFPGQAAPIRRNGNAWSRRFGRVADLYDRAPVVPAGDPRQTAVAQPAILTASLAALDLLRSFGVHADAAIGHSLGELGALSWAGAVDEDVVLEIANARGRLVAEHARQPGTMASVAAPADVAHSLCAGTEATVAAINGPAQTVVAGSEASVAAVIERARGSGLSADILPVSQAFHSALMGPVARPFSEVLARVRLGPVVGRVYSTVTGAALGSSIDVRQLLVEQLARPVLFAQALAALRAEPDGARAWFVEVGPGAILSRLLASQGLDAVSVDACSDSLAPLLEVLARAFCAGLDVDLSKLFADRFTRPFDPDRPPRFLENPCESGAPKDDLARRAPAPAPAPVPVPAPSTVPAPGSPLALVTRLVAERAGLPAPTLSADLRLLADLHLNSITVAQLTAEAARAMGRRPPSVPTDLARTTLGELARVLAEMPEQRAGETVHAVPDGVDAWFRPFVVDWVEEPSSPGATTDGSGWELVGDEGDPLLAMLRPLQREGARGGVALALPSDPERQLPKLLEAHARLRALPERPRLLVVQTSVGGAAFARTVHLETSAATCVLEVPAGHDGGATWTAREAAATVTGHREVRYTRDGARLVPRLRALDATGDQPALGPNDHVLAVGGGKGITAECALSLLAAPGCAVSAIGRADPAEDPELAANLSRLEVAGGRYFRADVTDPGALARAVREGERATGRPITAVLFGAGWNQPIGLDVLSLEDCRRALRPKIVGLANVLAATDPRTLRLLITFGSIIGRFGMRGEAHYALANERLVSMTEAWAAEHPARRALAIEWSAWAGIGMAARLGVLEGLRGQGVVPIPPDAGVALFHRLLGSCGGGDQPVAIVATGRFGSPPTAPRGRSLPLWRFLENPRLHVPDVELVCDATLSQVRDPYLAEHRIGGSSVLPAVVSMEAMAQAAIALTGERTRLPAFEDVALARPVTVADERVVRISALVIGGGRVKLSIRSDETAFQIDHVTATCSFADESATTAAPAERSLPAMTVTPEAFYGPGRLFLQGPRFQRVRGFQQLAARRCAFDVGEDDGQSWFSAFQGSTLVLGDPGARDAFVHGIQACIPDRLLVPVGVRRMVPGSGRGPYRVEARERSQSGDLFEYDVVVWSADPSAAPEVWSGLRLQAIGPLTPTPLPLAALVPLLERSVEGVSFGVANGDLEREARARLSLARAGGVPGAGHRADGRPEASASSISLAHTGSITLAAVRDAGAVGCDLEEVSARPEGTWRAMLGEARFALAQQIARVRGELLDDAATRVWTAVESLKKAGQSESAPVLLADGAGARVILRSGAATVVSLLTTVGESQRALAIGVASFASV
jgi:enediyne polyketide synthase